MVVTPKISVLMGVYNCEGTVADAIQSIIAQTCPDWELIICDDGSSDHTYDAVYGLAQKEARIVLIRNEKNMGLAPTLNHCLRYARGTYTARMDGDDVCAETRFEKELAVLERDPDLAVVSCAMDFFDEGGTYGVSRYDACPRKKDLIKRSPFCHAGCMMRRSVLEALGGYSEDEAVRRMEDYDLWFRLYQAGYRGCNLPEVLYSMRDDRQAYRRRKFKFRLNSAKLKLRIYREFRPGFKYVPYILVPVVKGLLPEKLYVYLHKKKLEQQMRSGV